MTDLSYRSLISWKVDSNTCPTLEGKFRIDMFYPQYSRFEVISSVVALVVFIAIVGKQHEL